jgi:hypothetical protein
MMITGKRGVIGIQESRQFQRQPSSSLCLSGSEGEYRLLSTVAIERVEGGFQQASVGVQCRPDGSDG